MRFRQIGQRYRDFSLFIGLAIISLILIFSNENRQVETIKFWMTGVIGVAGNEWARVSEYFSLREKNRELLTENTRLALENMALQEMRLENERLKKLLDFKQSASLNLIPSKVIGRREHGLVHSLLLNVGTKDSIRKDMPLVVPQGVVGKTYRVASDRCIAQLLTDRNFSVSALVQRSRVRGIVSWIGDDVCLLNNVVHRADVKVGDLVVTSGYGEIFPPGLPIGEVVKIKQNPRSLFSRIEIKPLVDFNKIEEVFIIRYSKKETQEQQ